MRVAMGIAALLCVGIGVFPAPLYAILPYAVDYHPYDASHVTGQLQLLIFAMLAFIFLVRMKWYPPEIPSVVLNSDWFYRWLAPRLGRPVLGAVMGVWSVFVRILIWYRNMGWAALDRVMHAPISGPTVPGRAVMVQALLLSLLLLLGYLLLS
jgi:multicomponent Na+:H+ antiporter subunit D